MAQIIKVLALRFSTISSAKQPWKVPKRNLRMKTSSTVRSAASVSPFRLPAGQTKEARANFILLVMQERGALCHSRSNWPDPENGLAQPVFRHLITKTCCSYHLMWNIKVLFLELLNRHSDLQTAALLFPASSGLHKTWEGWEHLQPKGAPLPNPSPHWKLLLGEGGSWEGAKERG